MYSLIVPHPVQILASQFEGVMIDPLSFSPTNQPCQVYINPSPSH